MKMVIASIEDIYISYTSGYRTGTNRYEVGKTGSEHLYIGDTLDGTEEYEILGKVQKIDHALQLLHKAVKDFYGERTGNSGGINNTDCKHKL